MTDADSSSKARHWLRRAAFRFMLCFLLLMSLPLAVGYLPWMGWTFGAWRDLWKGPIIWIGDPVLHLSHPVVYQRTGSGDTTHDWIFLGLAAALSAVIAAIWAWWDRRDDAGKDCFRIYLRYTLGTMMLVYGIMKVFDQQFSPPTGLDLVEAFGQATPQKLAWTYVGYSIPYTVFAGALECLGGALLFFRRSATLGAVVSAIVLTNVVMMNVCYDISVKLNSTLYLVMALVILAPSAMRFLRFFLLHEPVEPEQVQGLAGMGWKRWTRIGLKTLFLGSLLVYQVSGGWNAWTHRAPEAGPLNGLYEIETLMVDGVDQPPLFTDKARWRWMEVGATYLRIAAVDGLRTPYCKASFDPKTSQLSIQPGRAPRPWEIQAPSGSVSATFVDATHLHLVGTLNGKTVDLLARKADASKFPLTAHRTHWVTELPYEH